MKIFASSVVLTVVLVLAEAAVVDDQVQNTSENAVYCMFYDPNCAKTSDNDTDCFSSRNCYDEPDSDPAHEVFCYTVWQNGTEADTYVIKNQGCITNHAGTQDHCRERTECVEESPGKNHMFCCCTGDNCNKDFRWIPTVKVTSPPSVPAQQQVSSKFYLPLYSAVPVLVLLVIGLAGAYIYRQKKSAQFNSLSQSEESPITPPSPNFIHRPVQLIEIKARGRFGAVWKGMVGDEKAAVKIFPLQDKQSWFAEQEIYNLPQMSHENVLKFIGVDKRGDGLQLEFWLITAFHEQGSLCDFLKLNTISLDEMCKISLGIANGLTHLHTEIPCLRGSGIKPAIAHRDFKSKNVLIRSDNTACIGDFGLALQFKPNEIVGDTHGQVGTRRYMAPEVLEGAINFSRDAFLRIDMYACGLVMWEVATRCRDIGIVTPYKLPFEAEATQHPTLEEISDLVVNRKVRPELKEVWRKHEALSILCETIEECWDHDAEARLSASCVLERLILVKSIITSMDAVNEEDDTRLLTHEALNNTINSQLTQPMVPHIIMQTLNHSD
jgi:activin receptor type-2B